MSRFRILPSLYLLAFLSFTGLSQSLSTPKDGNGITTDDLLKIFQSVPLDTVRDPLSPVGIQNRQNITRFLKLRLSRIASTAGGTQSGHKFLEQPFETKMFSPSQDEERIQAVNYILVLQGSKSNTKEDKPLVIMANYDTDLNEVSPIDDNGSGIVLLVALGDYLAQQISRKKIHLDRTVILAATDMALSKYEYGVPTGATTGGGQIARHWLPNFLNGTKFGGAIVLDSVMNFNDKTRSQTEAGGFSKAFPSAYEKMSHSEFTGNFLAVVQRDDHLDNPLAEAFARGWSKSESPESETSVKPELLIFKYPNETLHSESELHFLRSEQSEFWNHFYERSKKELPAILLTDTGKYRQKSCKPTGCTLATMATHKNLGFMKQTANAVYSTILELQIDSPESENGGSQRAISMWTFPLAVIITLACGKLVL